MNEIGAAALVVDARTRALRVFVASVTQAQSDNPRQLVLRHALDMGLLSGILDSTEWEDYPRKYEVVRNHKRFLSEMPIIIMGDYSARTSAGRTAVFSMGKEEDEPKDGHRKVLIVGGLGNVFGGRGGLRILGQPIVSTIIRGPVDVEELVGAGNSNCASAASAWEGVKLLADTDSKSVFLVEGQSNYTNVIRFRSTSTEGTTCFPVEHREEMFSIESIVRRMVLSSAYYGLVCGRHDQERPSEREIRAAAKQNVEEYLIAKSSNDWQCSDRLGRGFEMIGPIDDAIVKIAEELGVEYLEALRSFKAAQQWVAKRFYPPETESFAGQTQCVCFQRISGDGADGFSITGTDHTEVTSLPGWRLGPIAGLVRRHGFAVVTLPGETGNLIRAMSDKDAAREYLHNWKVVVGKDERVTFKNEQEGVSLVFGTDSSCSITASGGGGVCHLDDMLLVVEAWISDWDFIQSLA